MIFERTWHMILPIYWEPEILLKQLYVYHFRDKCVVAFYAKIQDGRQKWPKNDFERTWAGIHKTC